MISRTTLGLITATATILLAGCDGGTALTPPSAGFARTRANATPAPCTYVQSLNPKPGYFPRTRLMAAIWTTVSFKNCGASFPVRAVLGGHRTGYVEADPWTGENSFNALPRWDVWTSLPGDNRVYSTPTIDQEPVDVASSYDIWVKVYNALTGEVIESRTVTVLTPATPVVVLPVP